MKSEYLSAKQAANRLGISLSSLYAYVSRGMIRSEPDSVKRRRRYRTEDVETLLKRKSDRMTTESRLAGALNWGEPICESELSLIQDGELYYRGRAVMKLALEASFEEVAEILWGGSCPVIIPKFPKSLQNIWKNFDSLHRFSMALTWMASRDKRALDLRPPGVRRTGGRILGGIFSTQCQLEEGKSLVQALADAWGCGRTELEAALVQCADHELNVSAFSARCVASAGASPYQVVQAGLAALSGFRHGGYSYRVEALFREAERMGAEQAVRSYLQRGVSPPGFGHPLYPKGDPRGRELLTLLAPLDPLAEELTQVCRDFLQEEPNIDIALVTLSRQLKLPEGAPITIFALGRTLGWLAHALEQYSTQKLIRPRARYVGPVPE